MKNISHAQISLAWKSFSLRFGPRDILHQYAEKKNVWELEDVIEAEQFIQISHKAMLLGLFTENYISREKFEEYQKVSVTREAIKLGYSGELY